MNVASVPIAARLDATGSARTPAIACRHHVEVDGRHVSMRSYGALSASRVILCLPGLLETQKVFTPLHSLADRDRDCLIVTMDYCGRGESGPLPSGARYRMSSYVMDAMAVLSTVRRWLGGGLRQTSLLGHSMGGLIAMQIAKDPEARISSLILNDIGTTLEWWGIYAVLARIRGHPRISEIATELDVQPEVLRDVLNPLHLDLPYESDLWGVRFERLVASFDGVVGLLHSQCSPVCNGTVAALTKSVIPQLEICAVDGDTHPVPWNEPTIEWLARVIGLSECDPLLSESGPSTAPTGRWGSTSTIEIEASPANRSSTAMTAFNGSPKAHPHTGPRVPSDNQSSNPAFQREPGSSAYQARQLQTALITGATSGIGQVVSELLARAGWRVMVCGRTPASTEGAVARLSTEVGAGRVEGVVLELSDLASVASACERLILNGAPIDVLINNAGCAGIRGRTRSGFEYNFGVHHVGHFALTVGLWPLLRIRPGARIVTVASRAHRWVRRWTWDELHKPTSSLTGVVEYGRSKLANILFASELARRAAGFGVTSYSVHPGVLDTGIWRRLPRCLQAVNRLRLGPVERGADAVLHCALHARECDSGSYFNGTTLCEASELGADAALAGELWQRSVFWLERVPVLLDSGIELVHETQPQSTSDSRFHVSALMTP